MRAGAYVQQIQGYKAFIPAALPPNPPIEVSGELLRLLSEADRAIGRLDGMTAFLPDPDLFIAMYVRQEALLSSQIEGTECSLSELLDFELSEKEASKDVDEVVNYVKAMNYGLNRLKEFPLSLRVIKEIHQRLIDGTRGSHLEPGEFRRSQNWIGAPGATLDKAAFVPPPVHEMTQALSDLEQFMRAQDEVPALIQTGLVHAQFETIHPFLDGNGRIGRLLITLLLCERGVLARPMLYLSAYFKRHRMEYYDRLMDIRLRGNWEGWLTFYLRGVLEVAKEAAETAWKIGKLREQHRQLIIGTITKPFNGLSLLDYLFSQPVVTTISVTRHLSCTDYTGRQLIRQFVDLGILALSTKIQRKQHYSYVEYRALFEA